MTIQKNIHKFASAMEAVRNHCMAARIECDTSHVTIIYPEGDFPVHGVRVNRSAAGLQQAIGIMERHWKDSFPGYRE